MIFEAAPGLFYQYNARSNTWVRIDGMESLPLASPLEDGVMTSDDFKKLMNLIIPPPQASLKGEDCTLIFRAGRVGLYSKDGSLAILPKLSLRQNSTSTERPWDLHRNTVGIDFKLNLEQFLDEVKKRGNLIERQIVGDKGATGDIGQAGRDKLDTGPVGPVGLDGANSPFEGNLIEESLDIQVQTTDEPRAIVDVTTEEISEKENYLVFTRGNIGNPDACPTEVIPRPILSPWLLIIQSGVTSINKLTTLTDDCGVSCAVCSGSIYYINIEPMLAQIFDRFKELVTQLKQAKEDLVASWLKTMVFLFNQQKAALCCALENCRSRTRNIGTRQYIEQQRIQAALGNFSLVVDGVEDRLTVDLDEFKTCLDKPQDQSSAYIKENLGAGCGDWLYELTIDASVHNRDPRSAGNSHCLMLTLPRGSYYAQIIGCCAQIGQAAATGLVGGEIATDETGKITAVGDVWIDGKAYRGEPVPGSPNEIYVFDANGNRKKVKAFDVGNYQQVPYSNRKGFIGGPQFTGRVAMLYQRAVEINTEEDEVIENEVTQIPNLGLFADPGAARSAYFGNTIRFTHAGGST
jgi:hypothetical protein